MKIRPLGKKWRADAGTVMGKRVTKMFDRKVDAERWLSIREKVRDDTRAGLRRITPRQEQLAQVAFEMLDKNGLEPDALVEAVKRFCAIASPSKSTPIADAMIAFERDLNFGNRSPVYVAGIGRTLNRFLSSFAFKKLHDVTPAQILDWLQVHCPEAQNKQNRRRELRVFFSWAVLQGLLTDNPVDRVPRVSVDRGRPEILTVPQVRSALVNLDGSDRAMFAIMTFAGLRPSEAYELHWEDIKLDRGFLEAKRGVRADNRNVKLSKNLIEWLDKSTSEVQGLRTMEEWASMPYMPTGPVFKGSANPNRWRDRVKRAIAVGADPLPEWSQDILRHSFGSYHLEAFKDATNTAHEMGHRGNPAMLYRHYRELVTPEAAAEFWSLVP